MATSTSDTTAIATAHGIDSPFAWLALGFAAIAAAMLVWYLVRRPPLVARVRVWLLLAIGAFPIAAAMTGNVAGYQETKQRRFCGGCHVMEPYVDDSADPASTTLAALHARNAAFGAENCYVCHADYGMFGSVTTKLTGLRHVWGYVTEYRDVPIERSLGAIHLYRPYPNASCRQCHSAKLPAWRDEPEHAAVLAEIDAEIVSCASAGCHGPSHPFSKPAAAGGAEAAP
jgi:cytochrome c-type protein NapC